MKKCVLFVLGTYLFVLFASAFLSPVLFLIVQQFSIQYPCELWNYLAQKPFGQYFDRSRTFVILFLIPFLLRFMQIQWANLKLKLDVHGLKIGFKYFILGSLMWTALLCLICSQIGYLETKINKHSLLYWATISVLASVTLACIEEIVFRGIILRFFLQNMSVFYAIQGSALIFAFLHFASIRNTVPPEIPLFMKGFYCAFYSLVDMFANIQGTYFFNLYALSCLLTLFVLKTKTLWSSIGFHAGLISTLMCVRHRYFFFEPQNSIWGSGRITDAWISVGILTLLTCLLWKRSVRFYKHD